jgi:hypothetical protein
MITDGFVAVVWVSGFWCQVSVHAGLINKDEDWFKLQTAICKSAIRHT